MMVETSEIVGIIKERPELKELVFQRGFLITDSQVHLDGLFLCNNWKKHVIESYTIWLHPNAEFHVIEKRDTFFFLIGHAYQPITMAHEEEHILSEIAEKIGQGKQAYEDYVNGLTGVFFLGVISGKTLTFQTDASAMKAAYWGVIKGKVYISSHCHLIGCVAEITRDYYVDRLVNYKYYKYFGAGLPGDLAPYLELKRIQCNQEYRCEEGCIAFHRVSMETCDNPKTYEELIADISTILENNLLLIARKWGNQAALSLTGGRDSTTALAGAHDLFSTLRTFSYVSSAGEQLDADAASQIAKAIGVEHQTYPITLTAEEEEECGAFSKIIEYNMGCIGRLKEKEIRKRVYFFHHPHFGIEIKSWVDEIGRARPYKRYRLKKFPDKIKPRYLTTMYKVFGLNRSLAYQTSCRFQEFLQRYYQDGILEKISWVDLLYWEYSWPASEALHLTCEQMLVFDVTIPFNNRLMLLDMLAVPLEKRIADRIQIDVTNKLCPQINKTGVHVKDFGWNNRRELMERAYWEVGHRLPY